MTALMQKMIETEKAFGILKRFSVLYAEWKIAKKPEQAARFAAKIGFPVAMKIISKKVVHKSDVGGVKVDLKNEKEVAAAFDEITKSAKEKIKAKPEGILVQKMESGREVIIGLKRDPQFGAVVMFGLGGVFVEVMKDVSFRIAPLTKDDCIEMIEEIKGYPILKGARGQASVNINALVKILMAVSSIGLKNKKITEIDLNPVIVNEKSAVVVDARIISEK
ncbi:acetate--CoA ligase family protein [Candidatus Woesearchaeota archaeon]|nr:acetate--CoA ligase family protein [Candidatus Woesearchaeota archaeon]